MIFDNIKNCEKYFSLHPQYEKAFAYLQQAMKEFPQTGKQEIDGDNLFASVQAYSTFTDDGKLEAHENYIDIQFLVSGKEVLLSEDISKAELCDPYRPDADVAFYKPNENACKLVLEPGDFVILLPHDAHRPAVAFDGVSVPVQKIVMKVKL